jgi:rhodanese-related sulfurtransferase
VADPNQRAGYTAALFPRVSELFDGGAQVVEVLPRPEYEELHLPGAISLPLKQLDPSTAAVLDRSRAVMVYCWDGL